MLACLHMLPMFEKCVKIEGKSKMSTPMEKNEQKILIW